MVPLLLACSAPAPVEPVDAVAPKTQTFPSFYGKVPDNLLMVSIDTLRRDHLARYGGLGDAPVLDALVEEGVALDAHRSCSNWTFPAVMCVVQGRSNVDGAYVPDVRNPGAAQMPDTTPSLATRLADAGWRTMLVTSNSWFSFDHDTDQGFDSTDRPADRRATAVFEQGLARLVEAREEGAARWYLHLHVKEPHATYDPPADYLAELEGRPPLPWDLADLDGHDAALAAWPTLSEEERQELLLQLRLRYRAEVRWLDDQLGAQLAAFERDGFLDDTLVVFWTDHGEQFWEHGDATHAYGLNTEENDALALFWAKNIVAGGWEAPTSHTDLAPTVLGLFGLDAAGMTGVPVGAAEADRAVHTVAIGWNGPVQGVVQDGWKLLYRWDTGERALYDLALDPAETENRWAADDPHAIALGEVMAPETEALAVLVAEGAR